MILRELDAMREVARILIEERRNTQYKIDSIQAKLLTGQFIGLDPLNNYRQDLIHLGEVTCNLAQVNDRIIFLLSQWWAQDCKDVVGTDSALESCGDAATGD